MPCLFIIYYSETNNLFFIQKFEDDLSMALDASLAEYIHAEERKVILRLYNHGRYNEHCMFHYLFLS